MTVARHDIRQNVTGEGGTPPNAQNRTTRLRYVITGHSGIWRLTVMPSPVRPRRGLRAPAAWCRVYMISAPFPHFSNLVVTRPCFDSHVEGAGDGTQAPQNHETLTTVAGCGGRGPLPDDTVQGQALLSALRENPVGACGARRTVPPRFFRAACMARRENRVTTPETPAESAMRQAEASATQGRRRASPAPP
jgi:hypothetical protein